MPLFDFITNQMDPLRILKSYFLRISLHYIVQTGIRPQIASCLTGIQIRNSS
jgi:hypothetical protein